MRARGLVVAAVALSCRHAPPPPEHRVEPPATPPVAIEPSLPASATCPSPASDAEANADAFAGIRFDAPATAALQCDQYRQHCLAQLMVTITNCRPTPIAVAKTRWLEMDSPWVAVGELPPEVPPGASRSFEATTRGEGMTHVRVSITSTVYRSSVHSMDGRIPDHLDRTHPDGMTTDLGPSAIRVTNPARDADLRACQACNGDWGYHAMVRAIDPSPGADDGHDCLCRSKDHAKRCRDGDDCEGWCEFERFVVVKRGPPDLGYAVGACSEFTSQRSCATRIPSGAGKQPPGPLELQTSCID